MEQWRRNGRYFCGIGTGLSSGGVSSWWSMHDGTCLRKPVCLVLWRHLLHTCDTTRPKLNFSFFWSDSKVCPPRSSWPHCSSLACLSRNVRVLMSMGTTCSIRCMRLCVSLPCMCLKDWSLSFWTTGISCSMINGLSWTSNSLKRISGPWSSLLFPYWWPLHETLSLQGGLGAYLLRLTRAVIKLDFPAFQMFCLTLYSPPRLWYIHKYHGHN